MHKTLCVISKCSFSFPQSYGILEVKPLPSKPDSLADPPIARPPGLGAWWWGSKLSILWENFYGIIVLQFVACVGFDFTVIVPLLLACCGFFFVFGYRTFLVDSSIFVVVNGCSGISCGFSVFVSGGWGYDLYSAISSPSSNSIISMMIFN